MKAIYKVIQIEEDFITVAEETPISGGRSSSEIRIKNLQNLDMHLGSHVTIGFPKKLEALYGIMGLFFPIVAAVFGLFISKYIAQIIKIEPSQIVKALCSIICFLMASTIVFFFSRKLPVKLQLQITSVLD